MIIRSERFYRFGRSRLLAALMAGALLLTSGAVAAPSQDKQTKPDKQKVTELTKKDDGKVPNEKELEKNRKETVQLSKAEGIAEVAIIAYGGRKQLETVRGAIQEEGTIRLATDQGDMTGSFKLRSVRKEKTWQDLLRIDLELTPPGSEQSSSSGQTINYTVAFNGASVWSAQNGQYVSPRPEAEAAFKAQLTREYMALLRYREDGSKLEYVGPETVVGLETNVIDLTNPNGEKTRYWLSAKTYRVLFSEYEVTLSQGQPATKYRIAYYYTPFRVVQNTLVPVRRVMSQDGKFVQEVTLNTITYSAKLDPEIFQHLQQD